MAKLYLLDETGAPTKAWELGDRSVTIGRGASVDVQIDDEGLSRRHFMICREGDHYLLRDLSSRNGTWVAEERTALAPLGNNDKIVAGHTTFRFCETRPEPATGPTGTVILSRH